MPTSVLTVYRIRKEVDAPNADFTLFIVGNGNTDFRKNAVVKKWEEVDAPFANFTLFIVDNENADFSSY